MTNTFELPVKLGALSIDSGSASIGFGLPDDAEALVILEVRPPDDGSRPLPGIEDETPPHPRIESYVKLKGRITIDLEDFSPHSEALDELQEMIQQRGQLTLVQISKPIRGVHVDDEDDDETEPHPDVAAGADRPVGTPALDAAAEVHGSVEQLEQFTDWLELRVGLTQKQVGALIEATGWSDSAAILGKADHDPAWQEHIARIRGVGKSAAQKLADWVHSMRAEDDEQGEGA